MVDGALKSWILFCEVKQNKDTASHSPFVVVGMLRNCRQSQGYNKMAFSLCLQSYARRSTPMRLLHSASRRPYTEYFVRYPSSYRPPFSANPTMTMSGPTTHFSMTSTSFLSESEIAFRTNALLSTRPRPGTTYQSSCVCILCVCT